MQKHLFLILFILTNMTTNAQTKQDSIPGVYYLNGVMETASGFQLNADGSFQFFFSQGALDRFGEGKWTLKNNELIFNSRIKPERDFALETSSVKPGKQVTVEVTDPNTAALVYIHATASSGKKTLEQQLKQDGRTSFPFAQIDSLTLSFEFCPDKTSLFSDLPKNHNHFVFRVEPWMMELFLHDFHLRLEDNVLTGSHPLLEGTSFTYTKSGSQE